MRPYQGMLIDCIHGAQVQEALRGGSPLASALARLPAWPPDFRPIAGFAMTPLTIEDGRQLRTVRGLYTVGSAFSDWPISTQSRRSPLQP